MLKFVELKDNKKYTSHIKKLYHESFPPDERVPFFILKQKAETEISNIYAIVEDNKFIGMLCTLHDEDILFLWYLAIIPEERNKGYGSRIIKEILDHNKDKRIILNIEEIDTNDSNVEEQLRRKHFYEKNGFKECGFKTEEYGVIYEMLCYGEKVTYEEYAKMMIQYSNKKLFEMNYKKI